MADMPMKFHAFTFSYQQIELLFISVPHAGAFAPIFDAAMVMISDIIASSWSSMIICSAAWWLYADVARRISPAPAFYDSGHHSSPRLAYSIIFISLINACALILAASEKQLPRHGASPRRMPLRHEHIFAHGWYFRKLSFSYLACQQPRRSPPLPRLMIRNFIRVLDAAESGSRRKLSVVASRRTQHDLLMRFSPFILFSSSCGLNMPNDQ